MQPSELPLFLELCVWLSTSVVQGQQHPLIQTGPVQISGDRFASPAVQLKLFWVWGMGVWFGQDVTVPVFIKGVLQRVTMRRQTLGWEQRVAAMREKSPRLFCITVDFMSDTLLFLSMNDMKRPKIKNKQILLTSSLSAWKAWYFSLLSEGLQIYVRWKTDFLLALKTCFCLLHLRMADTKTPVAAHTVLTFSNARSTHKTFQTYGEGLWFAKTESREALQSICS